MWKFPWTNFHELNLDWILKNVKELIENLTQEIADRKKGDEELDTAVKAVDKKVDDTVAGMQNKTIPLPYVQLTGSVMEDGATVEMLDTQDGTRTVFSGAGMETSVGENTIGFGAIEFGGDYEGLYPGIAAGTNPIFIKTGYSGAVISAYENPNYFDGPGLAIGNLSAAGGLLFEPDGNIRLSTDFANLDTNLYISDNYVSALCGETRARIGYRECTVTTFEDYNTLEMYDDRTTISYRNSMVNLRNDNVQIKSTDVTLNMNDRNDSGSLAAFTLHVENDENEVAASMALVENGMVEIMSSGYVGISAGDNHINIDGGEGISIGIPSVGISLNDKTLELGAAYGDNQTFFVLEPEGISTKNNIKFYNNYASEQNLVGHVGIDGATFGIGTRGGHILFSGANYGKLTITGQGIDLSPGVGTLTIGTKDKMFYNSNTKSTQFQHVTTDGTTSISMTDDGSVNVTTYFITLEADTRIRGQGLSYADGFSENTNPNMGDNRIPDMAWIKAYVAAELAKL